MSNKITGAYEMVFGLFSGKVSTQTIPIILMIAELYCQIMDIADVDESVAQPVKQQKKEAQKGGTKIKNIFVVSKYKDDLVVSKFDAAMVGNYHLTGDRAKAIVADLASDVKLLPIVVARILRINGRSRKGHGNQLHVFMPNHSPFWNGATIERDEINV